MARHRWQMLATVGFDRKIVEGSFAPNGAGAVDMSSVKSSPDLNLVIRESAGLFNLALDDTYSDLDSAIATVQSGPVLLHPQIALFASLVFGSKFQTVINIRLVNAAGAATDLAADANNRVHFRFVLRNSTRR